MKCENCGKDEVNPENKFCGKCGKKLPDLNEPVYIGVSIDRGKFQITFAPVEDEFESEDSARDAADHSCWNEDDSFEDYKIELIETLVGIEKYPYICGSCEDYVAENTDGACGSCGKENWVKREAEPDDDSGKNIIAITKDAFAEMIENEEGIFFDCIHRHEDDTPCKYHKELGGNTYSLTKEMILALMAEGDKKELVIDCNGCGTRYHLIITGGENA